MYFFVEMKSQNMKSWRQSRNFKGKWKNYVSLFFEYFFLTFLNFLVGKYKYTYIQQVEKKYK